MKAPASGTIWSGRTGIWRVNAGGGTPEPLTELKENKLRSSHRWPSFLPDGSGIVFTETDNEDTYDDARIMFLSPATGEQKLVVHPAMHAKYVPTGHLLYVRSNVLMAVPFDLETGSATGLESSVIDELYTAPGTGCGQYAFSEGGVFCYLRGQRQTRADGLVWVDRSGAVERASGHTRPIYSASLSPDGKHIAAALGAGGVTDIWIFELERDMLTRLTVDEGVDSTPVWSPDQKWIYFSSDRDGGTPTLFRSQADGTGAPERLAEPSPSQVFQLLFESIGLKSLLQQRRASHRPADQREMNSVIGEGRPDNLLFQRVE